MLPLRHHRARLLLGILASLSVAASSLPAYIDELNEEQVGEAYTLGQRHDQDTTEFFRTYEKSFPNATQDVHVSRIGIRTPYYSVVLNSFLRGATYPMSRAKTDYIADPYPFLVVISVSLPFSSYWPSDDMAKPDGRFWKQFSIEVSQNGKLAPRKTDARPLFSLGTNNSTIVGGEITFQYDLRDVASRMMKIEVTGPDRQPVSAEFDLDSLK